MSSKGKSKYWSAGTLFSRGWTDTLMRELLPGLKNTQFIGENVTVRSALAEDQRAQLDALADAIAADIQA